MRWKEAISDGQRKRNTPEHKSYMFGDLSREEIAQRKVHKKPRELRCGGSVAHAVPGWSGAREKGPMLGVQLASRGRTRCEAACPSGQQGAEATHCPNSWNKDTRDHPFE